MAERRLNDLHIGFAGLGLMGRPMARHMHDAGAALTVWNRTRAVSDAFVDADADAAIGVADTPSLLAKRSDIIVLMLADTGAVEQVLFGTDGIAGGVRPGTLIIDMGTTAAMPTRDFAARLAECGVDYVDAPVSGGEIGAIDASLTIMAGGTDAAVERARPLFEAVGRHITHIGDTGAGQIAKAANQIIVGLNIGAVAEALALVKAAGIDPARVREALLGGFARSRILEVHGQRMLDQAFAPGARITTQHKDLRQARELAAALDQPVPATTLASELYAQMIARGDGDLDHSALIRLFETLRDTRAG